MTVRVYLAAPLFGQAERRWNGDLADALSREGLRVFLPQDDADARLPDGAPDFEGIVAKCLAGVRACDVVVALLDGADADSGTCFECGFAHALGTPVVGVRTDLRAGEDAGVNAMLARTCAEMVRVPVEGGTPEELAALAGAVADAVRRTRPDPA